jgi:poly-gamma-glutamate capsule biosynthesis protein CapA/YwtB (metallophosphatase superfamily)
MIGITRDGLLQAARGSTALTVAAFVVTTFSPLNPSLLAQQEASWPEFHLVMAGDAIIVTPPENREGDTQFMGLVNIIRAGDAAVLNMEGTFAGPEAYPVHKSGGTWMHFHPDRLKGLQWMGFNLFSSANNHSADFGVQGILDTVHTFRESGAVMSGLGENMGEARAPSYLTTAKGRIAVIGTASSFLATSPAGRVRPDMQGRPGLSPLHYETRYRVDAGTLETLRKMKQELPLRGTDSEEIVTLGGLIFEQGEPGVVTTADPGDLAELTHAIRDAREFANYVVTYTHAHQGAPGSNNEVPADFLVEWAHAAIDAGADVFAASGPHFLRGIEIYKGKVIAYSLGNFIMENDLIVPQPSDNYELFDLTFDNLPGELFNARSDFDRRRWPADPRMWTSIIADVTFRNRRTVEVTLTPITLGVGQKRPDRGVPRLAEGALATEILENLQRLSRPFGTNIVIEDGLGTITIGEN